MKVAPIMRLINEEKSLSTHLVHTGQHYDDKMSNVFFNELQIPKPKYNLNVGSGSHASQTAKIMLKFEKVCIESNPDFVILVGDVNSTLACAITAKKMNNLGIFTGKDLRKFEQADLLKHFGKSGKHYFEIVRSIQNNPVNPNRIRKSIGTEQTFSIDLKSRNFILEKL